MAYTCFFSVNREREITNLQEEIEKLNKPKTPPEVEDLAKKEPDADIEAVSQTSLPSIRDIWCLSLLNFLRVPPLTSEFICISCGSSSASRQCTYSGLFYESQHLHLYPVSGLKHHGHWKSKSTHSFFLLLKGPFIRYMSCRRGKVKNRKVYEKVHKNYLSLYNIIKKIVLLIGCLHCKQFGVIKVNQNP